MLPAHPKVTTRQSARDVAPRIRTVPSHKSLIYYPASLSSIPQIPQKHINPGHSDRNLPSINVSLSRLGGLPSPEIIIVPQSENVSSKVISDLNTVLMFVQTTNPDNEFNTEIYHNICKVMISNCLIKPLAVPRSFVCIDSPLPIYVTHSHETTLVFKIVLGLLSRLPMTFFAQYITPNQIPGFIDILRVPDENLRALAFEIVLQVFLIMINLRPLLLRQLLKHLTAVNDGDEFTYCTGTYLKVLHNMLVGTRVVNPNIFTEIILPLYLNPFLADYYESLNIVTGFFSNNDVAKREILIQFLLHHWPETNSAKTSIYLQIIRMVFTYRGYTPPRTYVQSFTLKLIGALNSLSVTVAVVALELLTDQCLIGLIMPILCEHAFDYNNAIIAAQLHWHQVVRASAVQVAQSIRVVPNTKEINDDNISSNWDIVKTKARANGF